MLRILLNGCGGRMGRTIAKLTEGKDDILIAGGCDLNPPADAAFPVFRNISDCNIPADVVVDFSHPSALQGVIAYCAQKNTPLVMATTGLNEYHIAQIEELSLAIPVFYSANMSMGVNLLMEISKIAASFTDGLFDIEIIEKHHNKKIDAPSGTALAIADIINEALSAPRRVVTDRHERREERPADEIGIHSVRGGTIVGEHTVIFAGRDEIIEIKHEATSRDIFASGAIKAAQFIYGKQAGLYSMRDIIVK
ncbi:MAG: 4-hydroxy-tetrahydrodipicolinate reductase [Clostridia bacterium]|nr:4-hydroxy-tetrahydrodipicolinate reductase [Clostridia bacterium]